MIEELFSERIRAANPTNELEQELLLQELMEQHILASLSRAGFFSTVQFHGGTCLRIFHALPRFSEDLDFMTTLPDPGFRWQRYLSQVQQDCRRDGIEFEVQDKAQSWGAVQKAFLKTDSIGKLITLTLPFARFQKRKLHIKLEIDTNPPAGAEPEIRFLQFPVTLPVTAQALPTSFAGKCHALLCREYVKGRDWFDFLWYTARKTPVNFPLLQNALAQQGPWQGTNNAVDTAWLQKVLAVKINSIDWRLAADDVARFLPAREQEGLPHWSRELFLQRVEGMAL